MIPLIASLVVAVVALFVTIFLLINARAIINEQRGRIFNIDRCYTHANMKLRAVKNKLAEIHSMIEEDRDA